MSYRMKPLSCDPAKIKGMSERLIVSHYENNYGGAVKRLHLIDEQLTELDYANAAGFLVNGARRNAWPSGMAAQMSAGTKLYLLPDGVALMESTRVDETS